MRQCRGWARRASPGARPGVVVGRATSPLRVCSVGETLSTPTPFIISWCLERVILRLQDLILHRPEAGVAAQTGLGSLGPLGETLQVEGLEVRGKREDCAGPCREFAGKKGGGSGTDPGLYVPQPGAPQPGAPQPGAPTPRILRQAPANSSDLPLPASARVPHTR